MSSLCALDDMHRKDNFATAHSQGLPQGFRVLIAAGASGGHLYPALSLAESLREKGHEANIAFVSSKRAGLENLITGYRLFLISVLPFQRPYPQFLRALYGFLKSLVESFFIIEKFRPDVVIGFGSYVSFPLLLEAALLKKHTLIHEQNVSLGLANKALSYFADTIAVSFPQTRVVGPQCVFTGNPLRKSLVIEDKASARRFFNLSDKFTVLVLGGSQGSRRLNSEFRNVVALLEKKEDFQFIHITGKNDYFDLKKTYSYITIKHCIFDFLAHMQWAYSAADLVISRAGAGTISELAYFRKAAVLVPFPYAGSHQVENARYLQKENAAIVIEEKELKASTLYEHVLRLISAADERKSLEENIQKFAIVNASEKLAQAVVSLAREACRCARGEGV